MTALYGTVTNAVKLNAAGEPAEITYEEGRPVHASSITTESVKVEDKKGSREGAYRTLGNYYGGEFIQRLLHSEYGGNNYFSQSIHRYLLAFERAIGLRSFGHRLCDKRKRQSHELRDARRWTLVGIRSS